LAKKIAYFKTEEGKKEIEFLKEKAELEDKLAKEEFLLKKISYLVRSALHEQYFNSKMTEFKVAGIDKKTLKEIEKISNEIATIRGSRKLKYKKNRIKIETD
jgi:ABC-type lipoprotein release transport system permease subunit